MASFGPPGAGATACILYTTPYVLAAVAASDRDRRVTRSTRCLAPPVRAVQGRTGAPVRGLQRHVLPPQIIVRQYMDLVTTHVAAI